MKLSCVVPQKALPERSHAGFTLLEVLAVVGVIGILAVLLTPAVQLALESARAGKCASNLRAIGGGLYAYIADHDGEFPPSAVLPTSQYKKNYLKNTYWFDALNPYMGYPDAAPDRKTAFPAPDATDTEFPYSWQLCPAKKVDPLQRQSVGYGWNISNFGYDYSRELASPGRDGFGARMAQIAQPSQTIIIGDSLDDPLASPATQSFNRYIYDYDSEKRFPYPKRHSGGGNYLFVDGHVERLAADKMNTPEIIQLFKRNK